MEFGWSKAEQAYRQRIRDFLDKTLPDDAEICGCNGVCKGKITGAIAGLGLKSLDEVRAHTKASASCGSCTGLVEQLLKAQLGEGYNPAAVQPMCGILLATPPSPTAGIACTRPGMTAKP